MAEEKTFESRELLVIDDHEIKAGSGTRLRVVQWIIDGKEAKPGLEKREYYTNDSGEERIGKNKAFNIFDIQKIEAVMPEIKRVMKNPPATEPTKKAPAKGYNEEAEVPPQAPPEEEVPF